MTAAPLPDHPLRYALTHELHARPAPLVPCPGVAVVLALKPVADAAARERGRDRAHLDGLLIRHGAAPAAGEANHHEADLGRWRLKWESHTEFTSLTAFAPGLPERAFDPASFSIFPADWLAAAPGARMTSILFHIAPMPVLARGRPDEAQITERLAGWFEPESLACASLLDGAAIAATDFRIDPAGHVRMAVFVHPETGPRRTGRIVQRLAEIETYRAMSMLGLARARQVSAQMGEPDRRLAGLVEGMAGGTPDPDAALQALLSVSAGLERLEGSAAFRFGATRAYEALVHDRISVLREARLGGRQTMAEFMRRRFDPAMRTVQATETRLHTLSERAMRAGQLLSTQVEVARSAQNQALLESMDRRADLQLRLQGTVEGLSVVAISYYGVGLAANMLAPLAEVAGLGKPALAALLTPLVMLGTWLMLSRLKRQLGH